ncbi:MAG: SRPBCC family protein [Streptosporangiaceae bacterium]
MDLGSYLEYKGRPAVRFQRVYAHPVDRVWAAITEPDELEHWFPSRVRLEQRTGGTVTFSGDPYTDDRTGTVLAFEPPSHLAFTWGDDELHLHLEPAGDGCRLTLIDVLAERDEAARNGAGWHVCLDELTKRLDGIPSDGPHSATTTPWQPTYDAYVAAGLPSGAPVPGGVE